MEVNNLVENAASIAQDAAVLTDSAVDLTQQLINAQFENQTIIIAGVDPFVFAVTVFVLACVVGYYVVWKVTPALHTPLMSVTNAISSIIVLGALLAAGSATVAFSETLGLFGIFLASINIFGGFIVTQRMLQMFKKK